MNVQTIATSDVFRGWYRATRRHKWQKLAEHEDYGRCLDMLLDAVKRIPGHHELTVSRDDPNDSTPVVGRRRF